MKLDYSYIYLLIVFLWKTERSLQQNQNLCDINISQSRPIEIKLWRPRFIGEFQTKDGIYEMRHVLNMSILSPKVKCKDETVFRSGFHQITTYSKKQGQSEFEVPAVTIHTDPSAFTGFIRIKSQCLQNISKASHCPMMYYLQWNDNFPAAMFNFTYRNVEFWNYLKDIYLPLHDWIKKLEIRTYGDSFSYDWLQKLQLNGLEELTISGNNWQDVKDVFPALSSLTTLHLPNNSIRTLPEYFFLNVPAVKTFDISRNRISLFPITRYTRIETANISYNALTLTTKEMVSRLNYLKTVDLGGNDFVCCGTNFTILQGWLSTTVTSVLNLGSHRSLTCRRSEKVNSKHPIYKQLCECKVKPESDSQKESKHEDQTNPFFITTIVLSVLALLLILVLIYVVIRQATINDDSEESLVPKGNTKTFRSGTKYIVKTNIVAVKK